MASKISHSGTVVAIEGNTVSVAVTPEAACEGCKLKQMCNKESEQNKVIVVYTDLAHLYRVDEHVTVSIATAMGIKAALWFYVVPFFIILGTLVGLLAAGASELVAGVLSLAILAVYYFSLYLLRNRIEREIVFQIEKPLA